MAGDVALRRFERVWLTRGWERALRAPLSLAERDAAAAWIAAGRPLVAARGDATYPGAVALGLSLPPDASPRRVALRVDGAAVARIAPPLALAEALRSAPEAWRASLAALDREARRAGLVLRVHGSLAWQHLSGLPHLTPASDVDLLVRPRDAAALARALSLLARRAADAAPRLDGEVILPGGAGISWRELAGGADRVLVKTATGVALLPRNALFAAWSRLPPSPPAQRGERFGERGEAAP